LIVAAALMWSTSGLFAKSPLFEAWPLVVRGPLLAFWRAFFGALILIPLIRRPRWTWRLVPATLCFAAMNLSFLQAMTHTTGANAIWLQYTAPLWVFLVGVFWYREPATRRDIRMLIWGMVGVTTILVFEIQWAQTTGGQLAGIVWGLASGVCYAAVILMARSMRDLDPAWLMALNHLVTAILLAPCGLTAQVWPTGSQWVWLAAFGSLQMALPYVLFTRGVRRITAHEASNIALLEPLLVPVWVFVAWHTSPTYRPPDWWTLVGGACIFVGLFLRYRRSAS
jgi:drug/metabolite transporter (DMT)-like permease